MYVKLIFYDFLLTTIIIEESVYSVSLHPRHPEYTLTGGGDNKAFLWNNLTGEVKFEFQDHKDSVSVVQFSPNGKLLSTAGLDGSVHIYETDKGKIYQSFDGPSDINVSYVL